MLKYHVMNVYRGHKSKVPPTISLDTTWLLSTQLHALASSSMVHISQKSEWSPEPARTKWRREKSQKLAGIEPWPFSLVNKVTSFCICRLWWRTINTTTISEIFLIRHSYTHFASHLLRNTLLKNLRLLYRSLPAKHTSVTFIAAETLMVTATNPLNGGQQLHQTLICDLLLHMT